MFRPDTNPGDDWDLYLRRTQAGDIVFTSKIVMGWRQHEGNVSHDRERIERMIRYTRRKVMDQPALTPERRAMILAGHRYFERLKSQKWFESARQCLAKGKLPRAVNHARLGLAFYAESLSVKPK